MQETALLLHKSMEYCLNDQTIPFKSYAKKSPPLRKTASKLSIYINFKTLILPEWAIMCSFCCISSCKEKIPEILSSQKYFAGDAGLLGR